MCLCEGSAGSVFKCRVGACSASGTCMLAFITDEDVLQAPTGAPTGSACGAERPGTPQIAINRTPDRSGNCPSIPDRRRFRVQPSDGAILPLRRLHSRSGTRARHVHMHAPRIMHLHAFIFNRGKAEHAAPWRHKVQTHQRQKIRFSEHQFAWHSQKCARSRNAAPGPRGPRVPRTLGRSALMGQPSKHAEEHPST